MFTLDAPKFTRDDLSFAFNQAVEINGQASAIQILDKAAGVNSIAAVAEDKIVQATISLIANLKPMPRAVAKAKRVKSFEGLREHFAKLSTELFAKRNATAKH
jgi:hypothetical protein